MADRLRTPQALETPLPPPPRLESPLGAVRPLRIPMLVFGVAVVVAALAACWIFGPLDKLRIDASRLGAGLVWYASAFQVACAGLLAAYASREAVPGRRPNTAALAAGMVASLGLHGVISWLTYLRSPIEVSDALDQQLIALCMRWEVLLTLPVVISCGAVVALGLPSRLARLGLVLGFAAALVGDGLYRLACPVSDPGHVLRAHSPALAVGALGAMAIGGLFLFGLRILRPRLLGQRILARRKWR